MEAGDLLIGMSGEVRIVVNAPETGLLIRRKQWCGRLRLGAVWVPQARYRNSDGSDRA